MINFSLISNKLSNSKENMVIALGLSLTCLIKSVDIFVKNEGEVTRILKLPLTIGILLFAFGNTMPDAVLSITSAVEGESTVAIFDILEVLMINCSLIVGIIILGCGSILKDEQSKKKIKLYNSLIFVIWKMIILTLVSMLPFFKEKMGRKEGILLVVMYFLNIGMKTFWNF